MAETVLGQTTEQSRECVAWRQVKEGRNAR
jgi:hypothetical protein